MTKTIRKLMPTKPIVPRRRRVAAYARASSGKDAMLHSLSVQVSYYSSLIQKNPSWQYVGVYADEAVTGTKDGREQFQRMLDDCRAGRIDMVITKSISRFARNTVTLLETVRELKALGIDVYFEEQNIHSMSGDGELMLSILASYAQEESRSVSENCKWRIRKDYARGIASPIIAYGYGIRDKKPFIVESEAAIIRLIFSEHNQGMGAWAIAHLLDAMGCQPPYARQWDGNTIRYILKNERYAGDLMLQKSFIEDHLSKRKRKNHGELDRFFVPDAYPAIISHDTFLTAQRTFAEQTCSSVSENPPSASRFYKKLICSKCGKPYKRKSAHGMFAWNCSTFMRKGKAYCHGKQIPDDVLQQVTETTLAALGRTDFDSILIPATNRLIYVFSDGLQFEQTWSDHSRRDSWTDEMKTQAAEHARRRHAK